MGKAIDWADRATVLAAVQAYPAIVAEEIRAAMSIAGDLVVAAVIDKSPVSDGTFTSSISASEPLAGPYGWTVDVGDNCNYGEVLEYGRKPGSRMPPVSALTPWVWSHRRYFPGVETEAQAEGVALNIARKIAARGFAPPHQDGWKMYQQAADDSGPAAKQVRSVFKAARNRIVRRCDKGA